MRGTQASDGFGRTLSSGWGSPDVGPGSWSTFYSGGTFSSTDWSVNGSAGIHSVPAHGAYRASYLGSFSCAYADVAITGSIAVMPTGGPLELANLMVRGTSISSYYLLRTQVETSAAVTALIFAPSGSILASVTVPGITYTANMQLRVRAQVASKTLRMKVWKASDSEPAAWTLSVTDSAFTGAGWIGVRSGVNTSNTNTLPVVFTYDNFVSNLMPDFPRDPLPLTVLAAFGADLSADPSTWPWKDITADVRVASSPSVTQGRSDDTSQASPASCTLELDNTSKAYSAFNPMSPNWPNVKRNTPIWVLVDPHTRFFGYADGFVPTWDTTGKMPVVKVTASGILRRIMQGKTPVVSPMRHAIVAAKPIEYWPFEDAAGSTTLATGLTTGQGPQVFSASGWKFAAETTLPGSLQAATNTGTADTVVPVAGSKFGGQRWQIDWYLKIPSLPTSGPATEIICMRVATHGNVATWDVVFGWDGTFQYQAVHGYDVYGTRLVDSGHFGLYPWQQGEWNHLRLMAQQSGGSVAWQMVYFPLGGAGGFFGGTYSGTVDAPVQLVIYGQPGLNGVSYAHLAAFDAYNFSATDQAAIGYGADPAGLYPGELVTDRISRICAEAGIPIQIIGTSTTHMGAQPIDTPLNVLRECEAADMGLLLDGFGPGLTYITRGARYSQAAAVTLDMAQDQVGLPFQPADDDQRNRNLWKVDRKNGSSATWADTTGPLGTDPLKGIGPYDSQVTINIDSDGALLDHAQWRVHLGTTPGFRYPQLSFDLAATPALVDSWPGSRMLSRVDVLNVGTAAGHVPGTVSQLVEGYTETFTPFWWSVRANCSPEQPYEVFTLDTDRLEADPSSQLAADINATQTTFQVNSDNTIPGAAWTTDSTEWTAPKALYLNVDGEQMQVTNIAGSSSPQTFTVVRSVNGVVKSAKVGTFVGLWQPHVLAL